MASMGAARVRGLVPAGFLIGRSVHTVEEAQAADAAGGLDYVIAGTVFATASKPGRTPAGPSVLAETVAAVRVPVLAVGGMAPDKLHEVAATGAAGFAAISSTLRPRTRYASDSIAATHSSLPRPMVNVKPWPASPRGWP